MSGRRRPGRRSRRLRAEERREIVDRYRSGEPAREVAAAIGCSVRTVYQVEEDARLAEGPGPEATSGLRLGFAEREQISRGLAADGSARAIARAPGRAPSTPAPGPTELSRCPRLREEVEAGLGRRWSPQQISARPRIDHPEDPEMRIGHETIHRSPYVQSRGKLRREPTRALRSGRTRRRPRREGPGRRGRIPAMVPIAGRPPEVGPRADPGHREGDLVVGGGGRSCVATLVERRTRHVMPAALGGERGSAHVTAALARLIARLPAHLALSLTWDQGKELTGHRSLTAETGVAVYFCDPHSPWRRGSDENTDGLLRRYPPKGTELNGRPRETLGRATPAGRMEELLR